MMYGGTSRNRTWMWLVVIVALLILPREADGDTADRCTAYHIGRFCARVLRLDWFLNARGRVLRWLEELDSCAPLQGLRQGLNEIRLGLEPVPIDMRQVHTVTIDVYTDPWGAFTGVEFYDREGNWLGSQYLSSDVTPREAATDPAISAKLLRR